MKYSFKNDYSEGCHPSILEALVTTNLRLQKGYGEDEYSVESKKAIQKVFNCPNAVVHLVSGGTQANLLVISAVLRPHQSVISADSGHINSHEAGAVEATGHKIHGVKTPDGKLTPEICQKILESVENKPHMVQPKLVYISNSTELGTHYKLNELKDLYKFCQSNDLYLYMDGARLAQGLMVENNDLSAGELAQFTDVFYVGGTKNGALLGEAIVINHPELQKDFEFHLKQKGALLAKGRLLGIQFSQLMKDQLYFELGKAANQKAMKIKKAFEIKGCKFLTDSFTNQQFPILPNKWIDELLKDFEFYIWEKTDENHTAIRLITSWATPDEAVETFIHRIKAL
ncbi:MAG: aminotransferase class I/II-fold pyridoxal phosphate-dependent enzyme [Weeksellaceae bacterium]